MLRSVKGIEEIDFIIILKFRLFVCAFFVCELNKEREKGDKEKQRRQRKKKGAK